MIYTYNGINMKMVKTNVVQFEAVYNEDRTTYLYTHYTVDIQAVVNPWTMSYRGGAGDGDVAEVPGASFPATTIKAIRHTLLQPRGLLVVTDEGGNELLRTPAQDMVVDAKDGPMPSGVHIINVSGARTMLIRWQCEGWLRECPFPQDESSNPYIISNRYSDKTILNEYQLATREIVGHTIFDRSFLEAEGVPPDFYRNQDLFPNVKRFFQRKSVEVVQNSNGIELDWRVIDQEQMWYLGETSPLEGEDGSGILEIDGIQTMSALKPDKSSINIMGYTANHIQLMAKGSWFASQWIMIQRLFEIVTCLSPPLMTEPKEDINDQYYYMDASISRSLGQREKWVKLDVTIHCPPLTESFDVTGNVNLLPISKDIWSCMNTIIEQPPGDTPGLLQDFGTRGSDATLLVVAQLTDSCVGQTTPPTVDIVVNEGSTPPNNTSEDNKAPEYDRQIVPGVPSKYDHETPGQYPYTSYKADVDIHTDEGVRPMRMTGPTPTPLQNVPFGGPYGNQETPQSQAQTPPGRSRQSRPGSRRRTTRAPAPGQRGTASGDYSNDGSGSQNNSNATCAVVRLHLPVTQYTIRFVAERLGQPPMMPSPQPNDTNEFALVSWYLTPFYVVPAPDGVTPVFRIDGEFKYAKIGANLSTSPEILMGKLPFSQFGPGKLTSENFSDEFKGF